MLRVIVQVTLSALVVAAAFVAFTSTAAARQAPDVPSRIVEMQVKARGPTAEVALRRALADAVRQVNAAASADLVKKQRLEDSLRDLDAALASPDVTLASMTLSIRSLSRGLIDRVTVLDNRGLDQAQPERELTALVGVAVFEARLSSRKTIAVMPFRPASESFNFGGNAVRGSEIARRLADQATERLVQSGVLTVLDRTHIDEVAKERNFVEIYGKTPEELARFGKMLGADLLLVGTIETAGLETVTQTVQASGYSFSRSYAGMSVATRLLDVESGAITWAETHRIGFDNSQLSRMFPGGVPDASGTLIALLESMTGTLVQRVVESVAPIKVALIDGDTLWLNRGSGRLEAGMRLQIRGGGQDVIDPDTGESLGQAERTIAVIEVVSVDSKKSQCRLIEGRAEELRIGQIARPLTLPATGG
jgi:curli biogenesis system outer membrane secretion channel CsgG